MNEGFITIDTTFASKISTTKSNDEIGSLFSSSLLLSSSSSSFTTLLCFVGLSPQRLGCCYWHCHHPHRQQHWPFQYYWESVCCCVETMFPWRWWWYLSDPKYVRSISCALCCCIYVWWCRLLFIIISIIFYDLPIPIMVLNFDLFDLFVVYT